MSIVYLDSSALVKLVVEETGSELVFALWDECDAAISSRLSYPEGRAALAVHLASAIETDITDLTVAVWDRRLHAEALAENLAVAPATLS